MAGIADGGTCAGQERSSSSRSITCMAQRASRLGLVRSARHMARIWSSMSDVGPRAAVPVSCASSTAVSHPCHCLGPYPGSDLVVTMREHSGTGTRAWMRDSSRSGSEATVGRLPSRRAGQAHPARDRRAGLQSRVEKLGHRLPDLLAQSRSVLAEVFAVPLIKEGTSRRRTAGGNEQGAGSALPCGGSCLVCSCRLHARRE